MPDYLDPYGGTEGYVPDPTYGSTGVIWNDGSGGFQDALDTLAREDAEGQFEDAYILDAYLNSEIFKILTSGGTPQEQVDAAAELMRNTGVSAHAIEQITGIPLDEIETALVTGGYDISGNPTTDTGFDTTFDDTIPDDTGFDTTFDPSYPGDVTVGDSPWDIPFPDDPYQVPGPGPLYSPTLDVIGDEDGQGAATGTGEGQGETGAIVLGGGIPTITEEEPEEDKIVLGGGIPTIYGQQDDATPPDDGGIPPVIPVPDTPTSDGPSIPPIIPVPEEPPVADIEIPDWLKAGTAAATAIGGAVNVSNQFDFLQQSAEDQILANRNAAVDTGLMQNPDFYNPYGSQTTTGGTIDPATGQIVRPTVTQAFTPEQQALFDTEQATKQGLADISQGQVGRVGEQFGTEFDTSGFTDRYRPTEEGLFDYSGIDLGGLSARQTQPGVTGRNAITDAIIQREDPRFNRAEEQMKNDLLIRGFNPGTEGYTEQLDEFGRNRNDFMLAAQQAGAQEQSRLFGLESNLRGQQLGEQEALRRGSAANRGQQVDERLDYGGFASDERAREFQEAMALRNQPLNELNALRTGNQAALPQFQQYQGGAVGSPDVLSQRMAQSNLAGDTANQFFDLTKGAFNAFNWGT